MVRVDPHLGGIARQRRLSEDGVAQLFGDHHRRAVGVAIGDGRHDRCIGNAQPVETVNAAMMVDNSLEVSGAAHPGGAGKMPLRRDLCGQGFIQLVAAPHPFAGKDFSAAQLCHGWLADEFTDKPDARSHHLAVARIIKIIHLNFRRAQRVGITKLDAATAVRAHQTQMDLEGMHL